MDVVRKSSHVEADPRPRMKRPREPLGQTVKHLSSGFEVPDLSYVNGRSSSSKQIFQKSTLVDKDPRDFDSPPAVVPRRPRTGRAKPRVIVLETCAFLSGKQISPRNRSQPTHSDSQSPLFDDESEEQMAEALLDLANAFHRPSPAMQANGDARSVRPPHLEDSAGQDGAEHVQVKVAKQDQRHKKKPRLNHLSSRKASPDSKDLLQSHLLKSGFSAKAVGSDGDLSSPLSPPHPADERPSPGDASRRPKSVEDRKANCGQEACIRKPGVAVGVPAASTAQGHGSGHSNPSVINPPAVPSVALPVRRHKDRKRSPPGDRSGVSASDISNSSISTKQDDKQDAGKHLNSTKSSFKRCALHVHIAHFIAEQQRLQLRTTASPADAGKLHSVADPYTSPKAQVAGLKAASSPVLSTKHVSPKQVQPLHASVKGSDRQEVDSKPLSALSLPFAAAAAAPLNYLPPGLLPHPSLPQLPPISVPLTCPLPLNPSHLPHQFPPLSLMQHAGHPFPLFPGFHPPQGFPAAAMANPLAAQAAAAAAAAAPFMGGPHFPFAGVLPPHLPAPLAVSAALSAQIRPDLDLFARGLEVKDVDRQVTKFPLMDELMENLLLRGRRM